ncbi:hypothetical protein KXQ82_13055 [Mucilaginibacter sp. HMF5004]|uniref:hypothetical protein n=1 Tax=Mucilaginibacter rivuli TaxID=2857527 RepID=UPI001C5FCBF0|nr:hypothetical protein [Mucilaginibacter rivuli]MBW4890657.1 hypothetical protein [Mucilaginibacter rivuli]
MKHIKIIESIILCLFSVFVFSCAVAEETNSLPGYAMHAASQEIKADNSNTAQPSLFSVTSYISISKLISSIIVFVVVVSLIIVLVAFILYNTYSIRP